MGTTNSRFHGAQESSPSAPDLETLRGELDRAIGRVCPRWLLAARDDLVQSSLLKVYELVTKSEEARTFSSFYLKKVAYSALVDEIRRRRRAREQPLDDDGAASAISSKVVSEGPSPIREAEAKEIAVALRYCVARLIERRKLAITLHLHGHTFGEAATILGWTTKKVENLVYRGLEDLRRCLATKGHRP